MLPGIGMKQFQKSGGWDITKVNSINSAAFNYGSNVLPHTIRFSPDGLMLYALDDNSDYIYKFSLSIAFDITSTMTFVNRKSTSTENGTYSGGFDLSEDGTKMFLISRIAKTVTVVNLAIAWDVAGTWSSSSTITITGITSNIQFISFTSDGLNVYLSASSTVFQCKLTTPFDLNTATLYKTFALSGGSFVKTDGTHFYRVNSTYYVEDYIMTTPNDISTAVLYASVPTILVNYGEGVSFSRDGKYMFEVESAVYRKIYSKKLV